MVASAFLASWRRDVTFDAGAGYRFGEVEWLLRLESGRIRKQLDLRDTLPRAGPLEDLLDWARFPFTQRIADSIHADDARYARSGRSFVGVTLETSAER